DAQLVDRDRDPDDLAASVGTLLERLPERLAVVRLDELGGGDLRSEVEGATVEVEERTLGEDQEVDVPTGPVVERDRVTGGASGLRSEQVDVRGPHGADASRGEERVDAGVGHREGVELEGTLGGDVLAERVAHPGGEHDSERLVEDPRAGALRGDGLPDSAQHRVDGA